MGNLGNRFKLAGFYVSLVGPASQKSNRNVVNTHSAKVFRVKIFVGCIVAIG